MSGLRLSPDGSRLVTTISTLNAKRTQYRTALWQLDPSGAEPARRLSRSRKGESSAEFTDAGDVLFTSARPDPDADEDEEGPAALWLLPAGGGDARLIGNRLGGFEKVLSHGDVLLAAAPRLTRAADESEEERLRKERKDRSVSAILHTSYPVRHWDHDTGPGAIHLLAAALPVESVASDPASRVELRDLTPDATPHQLEEFDLSSDGSFAVLAWTIIGRGGERRNTLVRLDLADGSTRTLVDEPDADVYEPLISPDGARVLWNRASRTSPTRPPHNELHLFDLLTGESRQVAVGWDRWNAGQAWLPDGSGIVLTADSEGRSPVFLLDLADDSVRQVSSDDAAFTDPQVSPDGRWVYALRSSYLAPAEVVRLDLRRLPHVRPTGGRRGAAEPGPGPRTAGNADRGEADRRGRHAAARLAGPATRLRAPSVRHPCCCGSTAGRWVRGTRGPGAGAPGCWSPRDTPCLLPDPALSTGYGEAVHRPRLEPLGRRAVHRSDGHHRRRGGSRRHRRRSDGRDGRLIRRLHGQLGRRSHRPLPRHRHTRVAVGDGSVRADHRPRLLLGQGGQRGDDAGALTARLCRSDPHPDAGGPRRP